MKIPIKIIQVETKGKKKNVVILHSSDYFELKGDSTEKIKEFEKRYSELVKKVKEILPEEKSERKPSHFLKIGKMLYDFDKSIENTFEITNYRIAITRDFGLYRERMTGLIVQFGKEFTKKDILDSISFSHYIELIWHANMLIKLKLFESEKKRLLIMAKNKTLPNSHEYSKQLDKLTESLQTRKIRMVE